MLQCNTALKTLGPRIPGPQVLTSLVLSPQVLGSLVLESLVQCL